MFKNRLKIDKWIQNKRYRIQSGFIFLHVYQGLSLIFNVMLECYTKIILVFRLSMFTSNFEISQ